MFRFTIRDVLWLTVVVALGCALATAFSTIARLKDNKKAMRKLEFERDAMQFELEKATGQSVRYIDLSPDLNDPRTIRYEVNYGVLTVEHSGPKGSGELFKPHAQD